MTQTIEFNPANYLPPEQVMRIPLIAKQRGFINADAMLADMVKRDLFPDKASKPTKEPSKKKGSK